MCDSKPKKQEDMFPLQMFDITVLQKVPTMWSHSPVWRAKVVFALLPWTLLKHAVFEAGLTRAERMEMIQKAFACLLLYYLALEGYQEKKKSKEGQKSMALSGDSLIQCQTRAPGASQITKPENRRPITLLDGDTCEKALSLCYYLLVQLSDGKDIRLGALGTHFLEHFFGLVRRLNHSDDRYKPFLFSCIRTVMLNELKTNYNITIKVPSRASDSGAKITNDPKLYGVSLGDDIAFARSLITNFGGKMAAMTAANEECLKTLTAIGQNWQSVVETVHKLVEHARYDEKKKKANRGMSTAKNGMGKAGGLSARKRQAVKQGILKEDGLFVRCDEVNLDGF
jgi:hypothetical protein